MYTVRGEKVKSIGEVKIAIFLYINGIDYSYEKLYEEKVNEDRSYHPDFTIEYQGRKIYIEYFGLSSCYNENNELIRKEVARYNKNRKIKEKFQENSNNDFINLDYESPDGNFIQVLEKELLSRNIKFVKRDDKEIFNKMLDNNLSAEFYKFTNLVIKFIDVFKNMLIDEGLEDYMFEKRIQEIKRLKFKYISYFKDELKEAECRIKALEYLKEIYKFYQTYLLENHMIDYGDMICRCYRQIIKDVKNQYPEMNYKYVIVDEYQDITFQRFLFVKKLVEYFNAKLISVGDDWQSIYAFAGSRLELFNKFSEMFLNSKDDMYLSTTYRYGQELADITSEFIMKNNEQSKKSIRSIKNLEHPIEMYEYYQDKEYEEIYKLVHKIYNEKSDSNILILARTNDCLHQLEKSTFFSKGVGDILICNDLPDAKIEAITMHRSKGLTSDQVIVFGLREKLFPSKGRISHWIFEYFRLDSITEEMPFAEERRLFYVALTRTKNKVYLVVPSRRSEKSEFINELERMLE